MTEKYFCDRCGHEIEKNEVEVRVKYLGEWPKRYHFHEGCFETVKEFIVVDKQ